MFVRFSLPTPARTSSNTNSRLSKVLFSLLVVIAFFFYTLTISEIFEDYLHDEQTKNVANKVLNLFAIVVSILTLITIYNLN